MRSYTHVAGAILFYIIFAFLLNLNHLIVGTFFAAWISLFPDIIDKLLDKHRGIGHSIFWLGPLFLVGLWNWGIAAALIIGFLSHIFLDTITTHGTPCLYPLWKTNFVCLNEKRRVKTGTNYDKAVFLFILLLLTPLLFYATLGFHGTISKDNNFIFSQNGNTTKGLNTTDSMKNNFNFNLQLTPKTNKNITVQKVSDNETTVIIKDIEHGG